MKLVAFQYGKTEINEAMAFDGGNKEIKIPISLMFFLIEEGNRKILVDTGCDTMPGFPLYEFCSPVKILEEYGVERDEITDIILTHAHHDHTDGAHYYKNADIYIQKEEAKMADNYILYKDKLHVFDNEISICEKVTAKCIGGHSVGSSIVEIRTDKTVYALCGDECYLPKNIEQKIPTASSYNKSKSREFIEEYSKEKYTPILFHDKDVVGFIGKKIIF